jgi:hypothetical protein
MSRPEWEILVQPWRTADQRTRIWNQCATIGFDTGRVSRAVESIGSVILICQQKSSLALLKIRALL